jgi:hypothetical protein
MGSVCDLGSRPGARSSPSGIQADLRGAEEIIVVHRDVARDVTTRRTATWACRSRPSSGRRSRLAIAQVNEVLVKCVSGNEKRNVDVTPPPSLPALEGGRIRAMPKTRREIAHEVDEILSSGSGSNPTTRALTGESLEGAELAAMSRELIPYADAGTSPRASSNDFNETLS